MRNLSVTGRAALALSILLGLGCAPGLIEDEDKTDPVTQQPPSGPAATQPSTQPSAPQTQTQSQPAEQPAANPPTPLPVSGPCGELCKVLGGCTALWASVDACQQECSAMQQVMRPSVTDAYIACGKKATCQSFTKKTCLQAGAGGIQISVTYPMVDRMCAKTNTCLGGTMQPGDCDALKQDANTVALLSNLKMYTDAVHKCIAECIEATTCAGLFQDPGTVSGSCALKCGTRPDWVIN